MLLFNKIKMNKRYLDFDYFIMLESSLKSQNLFCCKLFWVLVYHIVRVKNFSLVGLEIRNAFMRTLYTLLRYSLSHQRTLGYQRLSLYNEGFMGIVPVRLPEAISSGICTVCTTDTKDCEQNSKHLV